jgi:hypothetical protein
MGYEELLDGEEHWLEEGLWPGWIKPHSVTGELVRVVTVPVDELEVPVVGMTSSPMPASEMLRFTEDGWSLFSIMMQKVCEVLELPLEIEQVVRRRPDWSVDGKWHRVLAGSRGALAGDLMGSDEIAALTEGL